MNEYSVEIDKYGSGHYQAWLKQDGKLVTCGWRRRSLRAARRDGHRLLKRERRRDLEAQRTVVEEFS